MSKKTTWADVKKHDTVELAGREYRVVKIKPKGKKAVVMVETKGRYAESKVKLAERVTIVKKSAMTRAVERAIAPLVRRAESRIRNMHTAVPGIGGRSRWSKARITAFMYRKSSGSV